MARGWVWLQLSLAWLPMWALFAAIIVIVHGNSMESAAIGSLRMICPAALLGIVVYKFASRTPWPYPFRASFVAAHAFAAVLYAVAWYVLICAIDSLVTGQVVTEAGPGHGMFLLTGVWLYLVVAGVAYANLAAQRSAKIEAQAARTQLDALRSQLHPHFLFNALHTIVQLIPIEPRGAARAAEQLAGILRTTIEQRRDLVPLAEEWTLVERYLAIERIRFGDRLRIEAQIAPATLAAMLPSFALQTLVENALRHGAAPRSQQTCVAIHAELGSAGLLVRVSDDGAGADMGALSSTAGTGLRRLRERMHWLYGDGARLELSSTPGSGFVATLHVPEMQNDDNDDTEHRT